MSHLIPNSFSTYEMTDDEYLQGSLLTIAQQQVIQNQIAQLAEAQLALDYDPEHPEIFNREYAHKKGEIAALKYLLSLHASAVEHTEAEAAVNSEDTQ